MSLLSSFRSAAVLLAACLGMSALGAAEVARWKFDATPGFDDSVGSNNLAAQGGVAISTAVAPARRQGDGALALDGTDDFATAVDDVSLDVVATGLTISAWINATNFTGNPRVIEKGSDNEFRLIATGGNLQFEIFNVGSVSFAVPSTGAWHQVAGVWDPSAASLTMNGSVQNGVMYLYVDGVLVAAADTAAAANGTLPLVSTGSLAIGAKPGGSDFFNGIIDDVRLFNGPLNLAAIQALAPPASALAYSTQPTGATAGAAFTTQPIVHTVDENGYDSTVGLGTSVVVTIAQQSGTGALLGTTTKDVGTLGTVGVATFTDLQNNSVGAKTLRASTDFGSGVVTKDSSSFTVAPGAATQVAFVQEPTTAVAGAAISPSVTVSVQDANGNVVTGSTATIAVAIGTNPGTSTLGGTASVAAVSGVATFSNLTLNKVGTGYTLSATSSGLTGDTSASFNITVGAATQVAFVQEPTTAVAGAAIAPSVTVSVQDANGNVVTGSTATIAVAIGTNPGTSTLGGTVSVAAVSGVATFSDLTLNKVGTGYTLAATSSGLTGDTSASFNITVGAATQVAFVQEPTTAVAGAAIAPSVTVSVQDANGNVVTGSTATIAVAIGTNPGTSTLGGTASVAAVSGVATFSNLTLNKVGTGYTLSATSSGLTGDTSATFNITVGTATQVAFVQEPTTAIAGSAISPSVTVSVQDANGNVVTGSTATIAVAIGTNPGTSTLGGTASVAAVSGVATFSNLTLNKVGTGYTLAASSIGLTGDTSATFNITPAAGSQLAFVTQPVDSVAGAVIPLALEIHDAFGNLTAATDAITIAIGTNPGGGTLSGTVTVSAAAGSASFTDLSINRTGSAYTVVASASGFSDLISSTFSITPDVAHGLAFTVDPTDAVAGASQSGNVEVEVIDQHGNRVTTATTTIALAFGANPGSATLSGTTSLAAVAGLAVFPGLTVSAAGNDYTLVASASGLATDTSATFDITAAPGGSGSGGSSSSGGGCGLGSAAPFAALMIMLLMMGRLRSGRRSDHHV